MAEQARATTEEDLIRKIGDKRQKIRKLKQQFFAAYDSTTDWRTKAIESYNFVLGDQWSEADKAQLAKDRRPMLVINKILSPVMFLAGVQRQQRTEVKLVPFEAQDARGAELLTAIYKWIGQRSREKEVDSRVFLDKVVTGLGFWKLMVDFEDSPEGELRWSRVSPLSIFPDPNWVENGWSKARFVHHALWYEVDSLIQEFPKHESEIRAQYGEWLKGESGYHTPTVTGISGYEMGDTFADRRTFWDAETQRARVIEAWWVEITRVPVVVDAETGFVSSDELDVARARREIKRTPGLEDRLSVVERPVKQVKVARFLNEILLDEMDSPFEQQRIPIFPAVGYDIFGVPIGAVENMKDPAREKNKRRSSMIELVRRMPHGIWTNDKNQGADPKEIAEASAGSGGVINHNGVAPQMASMPDLPQALVYLDRMSDQEIRDVASINPEMLGGGTQRTVSGRAIEARQRGGLTVQEPLLESFESEKQEAAQFMLGLIQQYVSIPQALRILGSIAIRQPESPEVAAMSQMQDLATLQQVLSGAFSAKYDVTLRTQPYEPSLQMQRWQILLEFAELFGPTIPPKVLAEQARDAGILTEDQAQQILAQAEALQEQEQMRQRAAQQGLEAAARSPMEQMAQQMGGGMGLPSF